MQIQKNWYRVEEKAFRRECDSASPKAWRWRREEEEKARQARSSENFLTAFFFFLSFSVNPFNVVSTGRFGPIGSSDKAVIVDGCRWLSNRPRRSGANDAPEWVSRH